MPLYLSAAAPAMPNPHVPNEPLLPPDPDKVPGRPEPVAPPAPIDPPATAPPIRLPPQPEPPSPSPSQGARHATR